MRAATNLAYPPTQDRRSHGFDTESASASGRVFKVGSLNEWQVAALKQIIGFESLNSNWDSYGSAKPSPWVIGTAIDLVAMVPFENAPAPYVMPVSGGAIQFEWVKGNREFAIEVHPDQFITCLKIEHDVSEEEVPIEPNSIARELERLLSWLNAG